MPTEVVVTVLAEIGEFYWSPAYGRTREAFRTLASHSWKDALVEFFQSYAFERQGRSPHYSAAAIEAVRQYNGNVPRDDFEACIWQTFLQQLNVTPDGKGAAVKVNPLAPYFRKQRSKSITSVVQELAESDHNLVRWASEAIGRGQLEETAEQIQSVRGLGAKISAWFLRDVVGAFDMDEQGLEPAELLQPIDIWTRRGASVLAGLHHILPYGRHGDARAAETIVTASRAAGVRPTLVNTGLTMFGVLFAPTPEAFEEALAEPIALHRFLAKQRDVYAARTRFLGEVLCAFLT